MKFINPLYYFGFSKLFVKKSHSLEIKFPSKVEQKEREAKLKNLEENYKFIQDLSDEHVLFLKDTIKDEENRQNVIENKLSQITGQSGIIFTLIVLFTPLFYDELNDIGLVWKITFCVIFFIGFLLFALSIYHASDTLKINDYPYSRPDINTTLDSAVNNKVAFVERNIKDLITAIQINKETNNSKAGLLVYSHRAFTGGFLITACLGLTIAGFSLFSMPKKEKPVMVERAEDIVNIEMKLIESRALMDLMIVSGLTFSDSIKASEINKRLDSLDFTIQKLQAKRLLKQNGTKPSY